MRRSIAIALIAVCVTLASPIARAGGGGTVFEFERRFYPPGSVAEATASDIWLGNRGAGALQHGPYIAYLLGSDRWIDPPRIPAPAVSLGEVTFELEGSEMADATVSFTVPDVEPGLYGIGVCNDPCTTTAIGDLVGGWFHVARDEAEARLVLQRDRYERSADARAYRLRRLRRQVDRLEAGESTPTEANEELRQTIFDLHEDLALARERRGGSGLPGLVAAAAAGLLAGLLIGRRRRRPLPPRAGASATAEAERILERVP